jgi:hypothetical protein
VTREKQFSFWRIQLLHEVVAFWHDDVIDGGISSRSVLLQECIQEHRNQRLVAWQRRLRELKFAIKYADLVKRDRASI